jgi:hypothetical protein
VLAKDSKIECLKMRHNGWIPACPAGSTGLLAVSHFSNYETRLFDDKT